MTARALSILFACTLMFAAGPLAAQQGDAQQPRFKSSVEVTSVDVAVVDSQGKPLASLTPGRVLRSHRRQGPSRRIGRMGAADDVIGRSENSCTHSRGLQLE